MDDEQLDSFLDWCSENCRGYSDTAMLQIAGDLQRARTQRRLAQRVVYGAPDGNISRWGPSVVANWDGLRDMDVLQDIADAVNEIHGVSGRTANHVAAFKKLEELMAMGLNIDEARQLMRYMTVNKMHDSSVFKPMHMAREVPPGEQRYVCGKCKSTDIVFTYYNDIVMDAVMILFICLGCDSILGKWKKSSSFIKSAESYVGKDFFIFIYKDSVSTLIHRKMLIDRAAAVEEEIIDEEVNTSRFRK